jgi:hypothetical protein
LAKKKYKKAKVAPAVALHAFCTRQILGQKEGMSGECVSDEKK